MRPMKFVSVVMAVALTPGCRGGGDPADGRAAADAARGHVNEGRDAVERLATGLLAVMDRSAPQVGAALASSDVARVRNTLRGLHEDRGGIARDLSLYPTWFIAAVNPSGRGVAGDRAPDRDYLVGKDLGGAFPCVRETLGDGRSRTCVGELSSAEGQEARPFLATVAVTRGIDGATNGAVLATLTFGHMAKAIRQMLNVRTARDRVQLAVGIWYRGRLWPSGRDNDVAQAWLVPPALARRVPSDAQSRVARGFTFTFDESEGRLQWGAAVGPLARLGAGAGLTVFRATVSR